MRKPLIILLVVLIFIAVLFIFNSKPSIAPTGETTNSPSATVSKQPNN